MYLVNSVWPELYYSVFSWNRTILHSSPVSIFEFRNSIDAESDFIYHAINTSRIRKYVPSSVAILFFEEGNKAYLRVGDTTLSKKKITTFLVKQHIFWKSGSSNDKRKKRILKIFRTLYSYVLFLFLYVFWEHTYLQQTISFSEFVFPRFFFLNFH